MEWATTDLLACASLAAIVAVPLLLGWRAMRRTRFTFGQALIMAVTYIYTRVVWRTKIVGRFPLPPNQGAVIVCNHRGPLDPTFIAITLDRMVHWMVAREYVENPALGWAFRICQSISVSRAGADTAATRAAIRYAQSGSLVGIFPEGRINVSTELLLSGRPGAAMVALRARVPVVPCYVEGSPYDGTAWGCLFMPAKVRLVLGQPIDLSPYYGQEEDREVLRMLTKRFLKEIASLAGDPEFEPQLAGRFYRPGLDGEHGELVHGAA
jgi:1-acyl-sn-glycerol-3-phosphate acyltransferase